MQKGCCSVSLLLSAADERKLAISEMRAKMINAYAEDDKPNGRWYEKCLDDLENMSDDEFAQRYKDEYE